MREKQFAQWILDEVKGSSKITDWYAKHLDGKPLEDTLLTIEKAYFDDNGLSLRDIAIVSIFIGLTTKFKDEFRTIVQDAVKA